MVHQTLVLILCSLFLSLASLGHAEEASVNSATPAPADFEQLYQTGIKAYQQKQYPAAADAFGQALQLKPDDVSNLVNLALAQYQLGNKGLAVGLLRKAEYIAPDFSTAQAGLKFALSQLPVKEIPHEIQLWEQIRTSLLLPVPMSVDLALTALFLFASGWSLLSYFGRRKLALRDETALPNLSFLTVLFCLGFLFLSSITVLKFVDHQTPRATVIPEKVTVYSAPSETAVALFDLYAGLEVVILRKEGEWVQVTYPGANSGWVPFSAVFHHSGRSVW